MLNPQFRIASEFGNCLDIEKSLDGPLSYDWLFSITNNCETAMISSYTIFAGGARLGSGQSTQLVVPGSRDREPKADPGPQSNRSSMTTGDMKTVELVYEYEVPTREERRQWKMRKCPTEDSGADSGADTTGAGWPDGDGPSEDQSGCGCSTDGDGSPVADLLLLALLVVAPRLRQPTANRISRALSAVQLLLQRPAT